MKKYIVITTINAKSEAIKKFEQMDGWKVVVVGDRKSEFIENSGNLVFLSIEDQKKLDYEIVKVCPYDHYTRKNIGYLYAIQNGADVIFDTDDDNLPYDDWGLQGFTSDKKYTSSQKFINIYRYFHKGKIIWPRGYPLESINSVEDYKVVSTEPAEIGVWQGMADNDADVDAIYRLIFPTEAVKFENMPPVMLEKGRYCPFNSQNTFWNKKVFPYLYLPATVSFRFTDILRGYITQRLFWEDDCHLGFMKATVYQERNEHDLMKDFKEEVECYLNMKPIVELLDSLDLDKDPLSNLDMVYQGLFKHSFLNREELVILDAWRKDFMKVSKISQ